MNLDASSDVGSGRCGRARAVHHITLSISLPTRQGRHQEVTHVMDRVVEIRLRGGAWAELHMVENFSHGEIKCGRYWSLHRHFDRCFGKALREAADRE